MENGVSVIIPALNEEHNIRPLAKRLIKALTNARVPFELIFVDDHSTDDTREVIAHLPKEAHAKLHIKTGERGKAQSIIEGSALAVYATLVMIDADLQYPPEAIPEMITKIERGADIVVARRVERQSSLTRRLVSKGFSFVFAKLLHNLDYDVQSGLKAFRKEIIERLNLSPSPWTFDLEFLLKARNAAYTIDAVTIIFGDRHSGTTKVNLPKAIWEIGLNAIKLKFSSLEIEPFHPETEQRRGIGFHYHGMEFIDHTRLFHKDSALYGLTGQQKITLFSLIGLVGSGFYSNWHITIVLVLALLTLMYFSDLLFNFFLICRSFVTEPEIKILPNELIAPNEWPMYTVLCPLYKEWQVIPQFVKAMSQLDYPKDRLQILLLLEEDDKETIHKVQTFKLPEYFETIVVPNSQPKTKPKALNYGLSFTKGDYAVIYDAEDIPEPQQLKKAVLAFQKLGPTTACVQAKLNFYNPRQNLLTRIFTAEYSLWFDLVLTGLQSLNAPIPLGGTSNHFRVQDLHKLKGWDAFNVTEDCDLGMRLGKKGLITSIIDSTTQEEANSSIRNWFPQRTRWIKGYIQTYLVHMREPRKLLKQWGLKDFLIFQLVVGGKILSMFINPFMWVTTILYFAMRSTLGPIIESFFPNVIFYLAAFSFVFGNFLYFYYYMVGCAKRGYFDLIKYTYFVPLYWIGMSICAWRALWEVIYKPHYWAKTVHGLHLGSHKLQQVVNTTIQPSFKNPRGLSFPIHIATIVARKNS